MRENEKENAQMNGEFSNSAAEISEIFSCKEYRFTENSWRGN